MSSDFFMRQIEGMTDMLSAVVFGKKASDDDKIAVETQTSSGGHSLLIDLRFLMTQGQLGEAEDLLFETMEADRDTCYLEVAMQLYGWMDALDDEALCTLGFPREEIAEGRQAVNRFYGVG